MTPNIYVNIPEKEFDHWHTKVKLQPAAVIYKDVTTSDGQSIRLRIIHEEV